MATYILEGKGSASLPRRPLTVTLSIDGDPRAAKLVARLANAADAPVRRGSAGMLIIPRVDDEITILAVPDTGRERFDPHTTLYVAIGLDSAADPDSDVAQLAPRDVSGRTSIELATIAPTGGDQVVVTSLLEQIEVPLPPLAARARVACRGALGVDQLPAGRQVGVSCVVDTSASMAALIADGTVAAAADIVAGMAAVVSGQAPVRTVLANERRTEVPAGPAADLGERVLAAIGRVGYGIGANLDAAVGALGSTGGLTVVITDAPGPPIGTSGSIVSRMLLTGSRAAVTYPGFVGATCPPPPPGTAAEAYLTDNPHFVDTAVAALIAPLQNGR
jgi:hypothetical protein